MRLGYLDSAACKLLAIQFADGLLRLYLTGQLHETKPCRDIGVTMVDDSRVNSGSYFPEQIPQVVLSDGVAMAPNVQILVDICALA